MRSRAPRDVLLLSGAASKGSSQVVDTGGSDYFHVRPHAFVGPQQALGRNEKDHHDEAHLLLEARCRNTFRDKTPLSQSTQRLVQPALRSGAGSCGGGLAASGQGQAEVRRHQSPTPRSTRRRSPTPRSTPRRQSLQGPSSPRSTPRTPDFPLFLRSLSAGSLPHFPASDRPPSYSLIKTSGMLTVSLCDALPPSALATASPPAENESMATRLSRTGSSPPRYLPASMMGAPPGHEGLSRLGWAEPDGADGRKDSERRATRSTTGPAAITSTSKHPAVVSPRTRSSVHAHRERLIKGRAGSSTPSTEQTGEVCEREGQYASREASLLRPWMYSEARAFDTSLGRAGAWQCYQPGVVATDSAAPFSFRSGMHASSEQGCAIAAPSATSKSSSSLKKSPGALEGQTRGAVGPSRLPMVPSLDLSILVTQKSPVHAKEKELNADIAFRQSMRSKIHVLSEEERELVEFMQQDQRRPGVLNDLQTSAVSAIKYTGKELQTSASEIKPGMGLAQQKFRSSPGTPNVVRFEERSTTQLLRLRRQDPSLLSSAELLRLMQFEDSARATASRPRSSRTSTQEGESSRLPTITLATSLAEVFRAADNVAGSSEKAPLTMLRAAPRKDESMQACRSSVSAHDVEEEIQPERLQACEGACAALGLLSDQNDAGLRKGARARRQTLSGFAHTQEAANVAGSLQRASTNKHEQTVPNREKSVDKQEVEASEAETTVAKENGEWTHYRTARNVCEEACCCPDASPSSKYMLSCESKASEDWGSLFSSPGTFDHHHHVQESPRAMGKEAEQGMRIGKSLFPPSLSPSPASPPSLPSSLTLGARVVSIAKNEDMGVADMGLATQGTSLPPHLISWNAHQSSRVPSLLLFVFSIYTQNGSICSTPQSARQMTSDVRRWMRRNDLDLSTWLPTDLLKLFLHPIVSQQICKQERTRTQA
jgi:hypothetical protein